VDFSRNYLKKKNVGVDDDDDDDDTGVMQC